MGVAPQVSASHVGLPSGSNILLPCTAEPELCWARRPASARWHTPAPGPAGPCAAAGCTAAKPALATAQLRAACGFSCMIPSAASAAGTTTCTQTHRWTPTPSTRDSGEHATPMQARGPAQACVRDAVSSRCRCSRAARRAGCLCGIHTATLRLVARRGLIPSPKHRNCAENACFLCPSPKPRWSHMGWLFNHKVRGRVHIQYQRCCSQMSPPSSCQCMLKRRPSRRHARAGDVCARGGPLQREGHGGAALLQVTAQPACCVSGRCAACMAIRS